MAVVLLERPVAGAVAIWRLAACNNGGRLLVSWPAPSTGFKLQTADPLGGGAVWSDANDSPLVTNGLNEMSLSATNAAKFLRLRLN